ncbi:MAG: penicillin-binding protein 2 [Oscillospiraceae bacterium]|nr:penicillin-binding protein 2 [Oscillospiraceae bacterium]
MEAMNKRIQGVTAAFLVAAAAVLTRLCTVLTNADAIAAGNAQGSYILEIPVSTGTIYDRDMRRLTNTATRYYAVVHPTADAVAALFTKVTDVSALRKAAKQGRPFFCEVTDSEISHPNIRIVEVAEQGNLPQLAQHLVGYRHEGKGVTGLQAACDPWLSACNTTARLECTVNATGVMLPGLANSIYKDGGGMGGIITSLERDVQQITEAALADSGQNGAAVVLDIQSGEILAMASLPVYDANHLADYLDDTDAPFLNRALCAYSVGSIFKLAIAAAAIDEGLAEGYMYTCTGKTSVYGRVFRCHTHEGHGLLSLQDALTVSCNPYFVSLSRFLSPESLVSTASAFGFGKSIRLAEGMQSAAGNLQTVDELEIEAEKANFSFGQGKLLATPLQVAAFTACIANEGVYCTPKLLLGVTEDGKTLLNATPTERTQAISAETARQLRQMMINVLNTAEDAKGLPQYTTAGGKTSTAQTGRYDAEGVELCHGWMTGFFPAESPRYAVTVMIENGGYGNTCAAPVFRRIIDTMATAGY